MDYEKAQETAEFIRGKFDRQLDLAIVLGSGLGEFAERVEDKTVIDYSEIPNFAESTVAGHAGRLVLGKLAGATVAVQQGRFHYYEGYGIDEVVFPVRVFGLLGIKSLILTNAAGSANTDHKQGRLMLIRDHLNLMGVSPLRGHNDERFGPRFPDMTEVYSLEFQEAAMREAKALADELSEKKKKKKKRGKPKRILRRGVYCALAGPNYETPAEIRMYRFLGADAVGMSTVPEAIAACHMGIKVLGISCISNMAAGISDDRIDHDEVMETGAKVAKIFQELLLRVIPHLTKQ